MSSIRTEIDGDKKRLIKKMVQLANLDLKGANNAIAESLRTSTLERFVKQKGPDDKVWKTSIRAREKGKKTLIEKGILKKSIRASSSQKGLAIGTNDIRAATHQLGDSRVIQARNKKNLRFQFNGKWVAVKKVRINIPARPFLGIDEEDMKEIMSMLNDLYEE